MTGLCALQFERRLAEETSKLCLEIARGDSALRQQMTELGAGVRSQIAGLEGGLRQEISSGQFELLKWCFLFWVGQLVAVAGVLGLMLRVLRP